MALTSLGRSTVVGFNDPLTNNVTNYTQMAWVWYEAVPTYSVICSRGGGTTGLIGMCTLRDIDGVLNAWMDEFPPSVGGFYQPLLSNNAVLGLHHYAFTRSSDRVRKVYFDGELLGEQLNAEIPQSTFSHYINIGRRTEAAYALSGTSSGISLEQAYLYDYRLYDTPFSSDLIKHIFHSQGRDYITENLYLRVGLENGPIGDFTAQVKDLSPYQNVPYSITGSRSTPDPFGDAIMPTRGF